MKTIAVLFLCLVLASCGGPITDEELILSGIEYSIASDASELVDLHRALSDRSTLKIHKVLYLESDTACRLRQIYREFASDTSEYWREWGIADITDGERRMPSVGVAAVAYTYKSVLGDEVTDTAYVVVRKAPSSVFISEEGYRPGVSELLSERKDDAKRLK